MRDLINKIDNILKESVEQDTGLFEIGDEFGISFSEDLEIATTIVGFVEDGIVVELDDEAIGIMESNGVRFIGGYLEEGLRDPKDNPCWKGYKPVGTKKKGGRTVPNCVPKEGVAEAGPFTGIGKMMMKRKLKKGIGQDQGAEDDAFDNMHDYDFADELRFSHEDDFVRAHDAKKRKQRALDRLSREGVAEGKLPVVIYKKIPDEIRAKTYDAPFMVIKSQHPDFEKHGDFDEDDIELYRGKVDFRMWDSNVEEGIFDRFKKNKGTPLPKQPVKIEVVNKTVEITPAKGYIGFAWHDSTGKEHYEEAAIGRDEFSVSTQEQLIDKITDEIRAVERRVVDQRMADIDRRNGFASEGKKHISPSGIETNMDPSDDDYAINYGKNGLAAKFRKSQGLDVKTGEKKVKEETQDPNLAKAYRMGNAAYKTGNKDALKTIPQQYKAMWIKGWEDGERFAKESIDEAEYQGKDVPLGKKLPGDVKKYKVYVKNPQGNVVKVNFGDKKMRIKKSNPERRKSFRARHNCDNPGPRHKARYWSCKNW